MERPNPSEIVASVCVTAYQHVNYIEQCLESIISQKTKFKYEIVLGEDESDDGTREICEKYAHQYPSLISLSLNRRSDVVHIAGSPTSRANFVGNILRARGKYIFFCDGDDYWIDDRKLQSCVEEMEADEKISMVFMRSEKRNESLEKFLGYIGDYGDQPRYFSPEEIVRSVAGAPLSPMQNFSSKREIFDNKEMGRLLEFGGSMHAIIHLLAAKEGGAKYLPRTGAVYRLQSSSSVVAQRRSAPGGLKIFLWNKAWVSLLRSYSKDNPQFRIAAHMAILDRLVGIIMNKKMRILYKLKLFPVFIFSVSVNDFFRWLKKAKNAKIFILK